MNFFFVLVIFKMQLFDCLVLMVIYNSSCRGRGAECEPAGICPMPSPQGGAGGGWWIRVIQEQN